MTHTMVVVILVDIRSHMIMTAAIVIILLHLVGTGEVMTIVIGAQIGTQTPAGTGVIVGTQVQVTGVRIGRKIGMESLTPSLVLYYIFKLCHIELVVSALHSHKLSRSTTFLYTTIIDYKNAICILNGR